MANTYCTDELANIHAFEPSDLMNNQYLRQYILIRLQQKHMTQKKLAEEICVSYHKLNLCLSGKQQLPRQWIDPIIHVLEINPEKLLEWKPKFAGVYKIKDVELRKKVAHNISVQLAKKQISLKELSQRTHIEYKKLSHCLSTRQRDFLPMHCLELIALELGVRIEELLDFNDNPNTIYITEVDAKRKLIQNIHLQLKKKHMTEKELAHQIQVSEDTINYYVNEGHQMPADLLYHIALVFKVSMEELLGHRKDFSSDCKRKIPLSGTMAETYTILCAKQINNKPTDADLIFEVKEWEKIIKKFREQGISELPIGIDQSGSDVNIQLEGRTREIISQILHVSNGQLAKINFIRNHGIPELEDNIQKNQLSIAIAYKIAVLEPQEQQETLNRFLAARRKTMTEKEKNTHKEILWKMRTGKLTLPKEGLKVPETAVQQFRHKPYGNRKMEGKCDE